MKNFILAGMLAIGALTSCEKESVSSPNPSQAVTVRYDFTASESGRYDIQAIADQLVHTEQTVTTSWTKTMSVPPKAGGIDSATLTVFPPIEWVGTGIVSNVTLKISVNGVEAGSKSGQLLGVDRANGIRLAVHF